MSRRTEETAKGVQLESCTPCFFTCSAISLAGVQLSDPARHCRAARVDVKNAAGPRIIISRGEATRQSRRAWSDNRYSRQKRNCLPEIATAPLGPRNDKLGGVRCFDDSLYESQALRRERHAAPLQGARSRCSSVHALEHHRVFRAEHSAPVAAFLVLRRRQIELVVLHGIVEDILPVLPALRQVEDAVRGRIGPG